MSAFSSFPILIERTKRVLQEGLLTIDQLALELEVNPATIYRWLSNEVSPQPLQEAKFRIVLDRLNEKPGIVLPKKVAERRPSNDMSEYVRRAVSNTCNNLRECLHSHSSLSSRHEALDELSKLVFVNISSILNNRPTIYDLSKSDGFSARKLINLVKSAVDSFLPNSLLTGLSKSDFYLRLRENENKYAEKICQAFKPMHEERFKETIQNRNYIDIINETFGNFIADSFTDEKELGQYLTPHEVVHFAIDLGFGNTFTSIDSLMDPLGYLIIDPSCGVGTFLTEALRHLYSTVKERNGETAASEWLETAIKNKFIGIDRSERMLKLALSNFAMFGVSDFSLVLANSLQKNGIMRDIEGKVDFIFTNPPFGAEFPLAEVSDYRIVQERARNKEPAFDSEVLFLERYVDWLRPGGQLLSIVPDSILTNKGIFEKLRELIFAQVDILSVISLPSITFASAGTTTKTSLLHLQKRESDSNPRIGTYFGECQNIGYDVVTKKSARIKIRKENSDLQQILMEAKTRRDIERGVIVELSSKSQRWDASFNIGISVSNRSLSQNQKWVKVSDICTLREEKSNPTRIGLEQFDYVEISDIDPETNEITSKKLQGIKAPSRARKVIRKDDVLVSTVRPERKAIGVVPDRLDGAICSTGFAVLIPKGIHPIVLGKLLQWEVVNNQLVRGNSGIAYPVITNDIIMNAVIPIDISRLGNLSGLADELAEAQKLKKSIETKLENELSIVLQG